MRVGGAGAWTLAALALSIAPARADDVLVARRVRVLEGDVVEPLSYPTDVAIGAAGEVWVADGVNDRVVGFGPYGERLGSIREVDGLRLSNPTAVATSRDGSLWIADQGNRRVAVVPPPPRVDWTVDLGELAEGPLDLTGLAVSPDGTVLWLTDNDGHRLLRGDLFAGTWTPVGSYGNGRGGLNHPFLMALDASGTAWVSDLLNGRVAAFGDDGQPRRAIARFGVTPGFVFRPKGIAASDNRLWVTDSVLGVVQAFGPRGRLECVLRDETGGLLHLRAPTGVAADGDRLLVVEMEAHRVVEFEVRREPGVRVERPPVATAGDETSDGLECAMCHLELVPEMERGTSDLLAPPPANPTARPYVSTPEACLSCHDGSVLDSRAAVFAGHGHPIGEAPPEDMQIPDSMPLSDGKLDCRTCHSAHTLGGSGQAHRDALMLRVTDQAEELCQACHGDMQPGGDR